MARKLPVLGIGFWASFGLLGCNGLLGNEYGYWQPGASGSGGSSTAGGQAAVGKVGGFGGTVDVGGTGPSVGGGDPGALANAGGAHSGGLAGEGGVTASSGGGPNSGGGESGGTAPAGSGGTNPSSVELVTKLLTPAATDELGGAAKLQISLSSAPSAVVTVTPVSSDTTEGQVLTSPLTFSPDDWNIAQTLEIQGLSDWLADGDVSFQVQLDLASDDPRYAALHPAPIKLVNKGKAAFHAVDDGRNGATSTTAEDMSGDGNVVVGSGTGHGGAATAAFRWNLSDPMPFTWLSLLSACSAFGTNGDGSLAVGYCDGVENYGSSAAVSWQGSGPSAPIIALSDSKAGARFLQALAVSDDGGTVGGKSTRTDAGSAATNGASWTKSGGLTTLGACGFAGGAVTDLSANGTVSVGRCNKGSTSNGQALRNGIELETAISGTYDCRNPPTCDASSEAVSSDGTLVVGWTRIGSASSVPFLWTKSADGEGGASVSLLRLPAYSGDWRANSVSDDGGIIVGRASNGTDSAAVLWIGGATATPVLAADYLKAAGLDANLTGWTLTDVVAVSRNGRVVAGNGKDPGGKAAAWRAILK